MWVLWRLPEMCEDYKQGFHDVRDSFDMEYQLFGYFSRKTIWLFHMWIYPRVFSQFCSLKNRDVCWSGQAPDLPKLLGGRRRKRVKNMWGGWIRCVLAATWAEQKMFGLAVAKRCRDGGIFGLMVSSWLGWCFLKVWNPDTCDLKQCPKEIKPLGVNWWGTIFGANDDLFGGNHPDS